MIDITIPVREGVAVWPGDTPYRMVWNMRQEDGDSVNLGTVTMSFHTGTHADAPVHFLPEGDGIAACDLTAYCGPAVVVDVTGCCLIRLQTLMATDLMDAKRVLFKTSAWPDHTTFPPAVPVMEQGVPAYLSRQGVVLVGVDVPSVDCIDSKELPNHHALADCGIAILESLDLRSVSAGLYELIALPLRLVGADGSPVRAILRR